jgi:hypothetical protein
MNRCKKNGQGNLGNAAHLLHEAGLTRADYKSHRTPVIRANP